MDNFSPSIVVWYRQNKRFLPWRESNDPYIIWLSEIILQQTRVEQGIHYFEKFRNKYPTVIDLANATEQEILNDWQGLGYYSRARNLHFSAKYVRDELKGIFPVSYEEIIKLKGVGQYTASAISSFAFDEEKAVVDGNVYRLLSRVFDISTPIDSTQGKKEFQSLADELIQHNKFGAGIHNQAIMELGSQICSPKKPKCSLCPLESICLSKMNDSIALRPIKVKKIKIRNRYFHFLIYSNRTSILIEKRIKKDIWENMYQFPLIESNSSPSINEKENWKRQIKESEEIIHILSHQKIYAVFHHFDFIPKEHDENWHLINIENLEDYPIPRLIDKYLNNN